MLWQIRQLSFQPKPLAAAGPCASALRLRSRNGFVDVPCVTAESWQYMQPFRSEASVLTKPAATFALGYAVVRPWPEVVHSSELISDIVPSAIAKLFWSPPAALVRKWQASQESAAPQVALLPPWQVIVPQTVAVYTSPVMFPGVVTVNWPAEACRFQALLACSATPLVATIEVPVVVVA